MIYICKLCNKENNNFYQLSRHLYSNHNIKLLEYYIKYENFQIPKCPYCNKNAKQKIGITFRKTCCSKKCLLKDKNLRPVTLEIKNKISLALKKAHKEGRHSGWAFKNTDLNNRSYPEKFFIKNVLQKYNLYSKYTIKEKMPFGKYFLDFAFLELKLDLEIDGQLHFRNEQAINHDIIRDNYLKENNWVVYRIAWCEITKNRELVINNFLSYLKQNNLTYHTYNKNELINYLDRKSKPKSKSKHISKYNSKEKSFNHIKEINNIKQRQFIPLILNSNIDFCKYGWVNEVANIIKQKPQKVNKWMKKYMPEFYENNCFKRKPLIFLK
jgi:very-short-patch-repair endonuclease